MISGLTVIKSAYDTITGEDAALMPCGHKISTKEMSLTLKNQI